MEKSGILYFDVISPFAYLHWRTLRASPLPLKLELRPVLFAGLLAHWGNTGPAEIAPKRRHTYTFCTWYGAAHGIPFLMPAAHPFNPLRLLRLIVASEDDPEVIDSVYETLYTTGLDPASEAFEAGLRSRLQRPDLAALGETPYIKAKLRANTEQAIADAVFGVPTVVTGGRMFWGLDALLMLRAALEDPDLFESPAMKKIDTVTVGAVRNS